MEKMNAASRPRYLPVLHVLVLLLGSLGCNFAKLISDQFELDQTSTAQAWETEWVQTSTEEARLYNDKTATVHQATDDVYFATQSAALEATETQAEAIRLTQAAPKPPIITSIDFPKEIPGNKSTIIGLLYFTDPDGDIKQVNYTVVRAEEFGGGVDDQPTLDHGTWENGAIKIYAWCEGQQTVTLEATIIDYAGNTSNPMRFSFTCK